MKVLIGTTNPGKIYGAKSALEQFYENVDIVGVKAASEVSDQPVNDETYVGAINRVKNTIKYARENQIEADYYMAIESGLMQNFGKWFITNIAVVADNHEKYSTGMSASFPVPEKYVEAIKQKTLGSVMDSLFNENDLRSSTGGVGILTHEKITRIDLNKQAFTMAFTRFVNGKNWQVDHFLDKPREK